MKRAKIGDVFAVKVPNGYKLYQWAYAIGRYGKYIRVFPGLYDEIPADIQRIVDAPHSYIIRFHATRAYRVGLAQLVGSYEVPEKYPFPEYQIDFWMDTEIGCIDEIRVMESDIKSDPNRRRFYKRFSVSKMSELPEEFQNITLLTAILSPDWVLYLFDSDFDLEHLERYYLYYSNIHIYSDMVEQALQKSNKTKTRDGSLS